MRLRAIALTASLVLGSALLIEADRAGARSHLLWEVTRACMLDGRVMGSPWPCLEVDRRRGFVVIADPERRTQVLVTPTARVAGVESATLLAKGAPNSWWLAWSSRGWLDRRAKVAVRTEDVGLAVNSVPGRTQDQLHVHIDCLRPFVRRAVDADLAGVDDRWAQLATPLIRDHRYRARWLPEKALPDTDPFRLLAADPAVTDRAEWTLVMVAARRPTGQRGFVLLSHRADLASDDLAAGEELLDHRCLALRPDPDPGQPKQLGVSP